MLRFPHSSEYVGERLERLTEPPSTPFRLMYLGALVLSPFAVILAMWLLLLLYGAVTS